MKYLVIAATTAKTKESGGYTFEFANTAITDLANSAVGCKVLYNFDENQEIGRVTVATNYEGKLMLEVEINRFIEPAERITPCFQVDSDEWDEKDTIHRIVKKAKSISYGFTDKPIENLPLAKEIKND